MSVSETKRGAPEGNRNREIHGGAGAVKAISKGQPFRGLAAKEEQRVKADYQDQGRAAMLEELATRTHTAARLYWHAIGLVADQAKEGDPASLQQLDTYVARFGWLCGVAARLWEQVRKEEKSRPAALDYDRLVAEMRDHGPS